MKPCIKVWPFTDAPDQYKKLSPHGGDEDWVAFVPDSINNCYSIIWMDSGTGFGCCDVSEHKVKGGVVKIGAHS